MKILLMRPSAPNILGHLQILNCEPLELEYLHTVAMGRGWETCIYDGFNQSRKTPSLRERFARKALMRRLSGSTGEEALSEKISAKKVIEREMPDVVAITGYITQQNLMLRYAGMAKEVNPNIKTVIGGVHAQLNFSNFYADTVDFVFRSEDVNAFGRLIDSFAGEQVDMSGINGLCSRVGGRYIENPLQPFDINELPIPDRSFFSAHRAWFRYLDLSEVATMKTAVSCPYDCKFCYCTQLSSHRYSVRDLDKVMEELEGLDCDTVLIADDVFLFDVERLWAFIAQVRSRGIRKQYLCYGRADFIASHPDIIEALAEIGFVYFFVGLEAITDRELDGYNKHITADVNAQAVEVLHSAKTRCFALMIAPIDATRSYFSDLHAWVVAHGLKYVTVSIFTPIPGTPLYEDYKSRITSTNIEKWDFLHLVVEPEKMTRWTFYLEYYKLTYRLYRIAKKTGIYDFMDWGYYKNIVIGILGKKA